MVVKKKFISTSWSQSTLAASSNSTVEFFNEDGTKTGQEIIKEGQTPTILSWNPARRVLATGWGNGITFFYSKF